MSKLTVFEVIGASNHCNHEREKHDFYATDPKAAKLLLENEQLSDTIWECACGEGHLAKVFKQYGKNVIASDIIYLGYGDHEPFDFLKDEPIKKKNGEYLFTGDIVTNPPFKYALDFVKRALDIVKDGHKVCMFLKLTFLEGKTRKHFFHSNPPKTVYVLSSRVGCAINGDFQRARHPVAAYAWYVWQKGYKGPTTIKWIN